MTDSDECNQCSHPFSLHALVGSDNPMKGGVILCPVLDCPCQSTWGVGKDSQIPAALPQDEVERLRTAVQTGEFT